MREEEEANFALLYIGMFAGKFQTFEEDGFKNIK